MVDLDFSLFSGGSDVDDGSDHYELTPLQASYLDVLERGLTNILYQDGSFDEAGDEVAFDIGARLRGADVPVAAHAMVGLIRLHSVRVLLSQVLHDDVDGHVLCVGCPRVGVGVMLRGVLKAFDDDSRIVYVQGVDGTEQLSSELLQHQQSVFDLYHLLDMQVRFLAAGEGAHFMQRLADRVALLSIESFDPEEVKDTLQVVHPQLSSGAGIMFHYYAADGVSDVVQAFLSAHTSDEVEIVDIDGMGAYVRLPNVDESKKGEA